MTQSNVIFFFIFAAYFVFITMRGELPKYLGFVLLSPASGTQAATANDNVKVAANIAETAAAFLA